MHWLTWKYIILFFHPLTALFCKHKQNITVDVYWLNLKLQSIFQVFIVNFKFNILTTMGGDIGVKLQVKAVFFINGMKKPVLNKVTLLE